MSHLSSARSSFGLRSTLVLALVPPVLALTGCVRSSSAPAPAIPAAEAADQAAPGAPELFAPGVISDAREQWRVSFTPDGDTAYFSSSEGWFPQTRQAAIYRSHRQGSDWSAPAVASFSGTFSDIDPFITPDGQRLYFSSIRPVEGATRGDIDIWMVERTDGRWGTPVRLGPQVNTELDELYPSASGDGTLYFASGPLAPARGQHFDIFRALRRADGFAQRERLGDGVNRLPQDDDAHPQAGWEFNPEISPDGRMLLFTSLRPGGHGMGDIYVSHLRDGVWSPARNLGPPVNTATDEYHPTLSPDGRWLYFARRRPLPGDFYRIRTSAVPALQPPAPPAPAGMLEALQRAGQAQQRGDLAAMRRLLRQAYDFVPDAGSVLFFLAREEARAGNTAEAFALLERLAVQGLVRDIRTDSGFQSLQAEATRQRFSTLAERLLAAASPLVRSDTAFVLDDPDFIPEGIAHDRVDDVFYVGSLYRRSVIRVDRRGRQQPFIESGRGGLGQVLGMHVDAERRRLWLATLVVDPAAPRHSNGGGGWAFLHAYELPSGRLVARHAAPDSSVPHLLNDIVVTATGDLYITDTEAHAVYRLASGAERLEQVHGERPTFRYPNGIAVDPQGRRLYVAHFEGISVSDLVPGGPTSFVMMPRPAGVSAGGIDGLYACSGRLLAVQGLFGFQQVTAFELGAGGRAITGAQALERRHPIHDWATTGAVVGGDFHYIANAQLRRLSPTGALSAATVAGRSTVLRLRGACPAQRASGADSVAGVGAMSGWRREERGMTVGVVDGRTDRFTDSPSLPIALQARLPGVSVNQGPGMLGSSSRLWLRGPGSLMLNAPLLIIDGARSPGAQVHRGLFDAGRDLPSRLEHLDPEMIERVEVISGIGGSAIYGPGASKGVILVTTKRGHRAPMRWQGYAEAGPSIEMTDFPANFGTIGTSTTTGTQLQYCPLPAQGGGFCTVTERRSWNPLESASPFRTGWSREAGVGVSGGTERVRYLVAGNQNWRAGVYENDWGRATNAHVALTLAPTSTAELTVTGGYHDEHFRHPSGSYIVAGLLGSSVDDSVRRGYRITFGDSIERGRRTEDVRRETLAAIAAWRPRRWLRAGLSLGYDKLAVENLTVQQPVELFFPEGFFTPVDEASDTPETRTGTIEVAGSYHVGSLPARTSLGVQHIRDSDHGYSFVGYREPGAGYSTRTWGMKRVSTGLYVQQHLSWDARLFLTGVVRGDRMEGDLLDDVLSRSIDASWVVLGRGSGAGALMNGLRFRAAYGHGGAHLLPSAEPTGSFEEYRRARHAVERSEGVEFGADLSLLNDRAVIATTAYRSTNDRALARASRWVGWGLGEVLTSQSRIRSSGVEGTVDVRILERPTMALDAGLVLSAHDHEARRLPSGGSWDGHQGTRNRRSLGEYRRFIYTYEDVNGDGMIAQDELSVTTPAELKPAGSPFPDREAAIRTAVTIGRRVRVSATLDHRGGQRLLNFTASQRCRLGFTPVCAEAHDPATSLADQARALASRMGITGQVEDATYTKLREVAAEVALPQRLVAATGAHSARLTLTGRNLHTWTSYDGLDPEVVSDRHDTITAADNFHQPALRSFTLRLSLGW